MVSTFSPWRFLHILFVLGGLSLCVPGAAHAQAHTVTTTYPKAVGVPQNTQTLNVSGTVTPTGQPPFMPAQQLQCFITAPANLNSQKWFATAAPGPSIPGTNPPQFQYSIALMIGMGGFPGPGQYQCTVRVLDATGKPLDPNCFQTVTFTVNPPSQP